MVVYRSLSGENKRASNDSRMDAFPSPKDSFGGNPSDKRLSRDSKLSVDTLQRTFYYFLEQAPTVKIRSSSQVNLRLDATYFKHFCLLCYQGNADGYTQLIRFTDAEHTEQIKEDLNNLVNLSIPSDTPS